MRAKAARNPHFSDHDRSPDPISNHMRPGKCVHRRTSRRTLLRRHILVRLLRPRVVARDNAAATIAENDQPIRVMRYQRLIQPAGNIKPLLPLSLRGGVSCMISCHF